MKKIIAVVCAILMVLSMSACAGSKDDGKYVIGVCQLVEHEALSAATQGFMDAIIAELGEENVEFDVQIAAGDSATCTNIVLDFISKQNSKLKSVEVMTVDGNGKVYFKTKNQKYQILNYTLKEGVQW